MKPGDILRAFSRHLLHRSGPLDAFLAFGRVHGFPQIDAALFVIAAAIGLF
jgi:hypothetical protein